MSISKCVYFQYVKEKGVSTSNQRAKMIATENTEATEYFLSVFSVLSVADNTNNDSHNDL
jgi:hypothetical protein